jgi:hypothetical protein
MLQVIKEEEEDCFFIKNLSWALFFFLKSEIADVVLASPQQSQRFRSL